MFSNLLVPLDGSRLAESVLPVVRRLAGQMRCAVKLLHVIEKRAPSTIHGDTHLQDAAGAERYLKTISGHLGEWGLAVSSHVHTVPQGDVPLCIADHAEELEQDLIVLCTHGHGGVRRFVFGTNAEQVLTHGKTPVILVKADEHGRPPIFGPKKIVVLMDKTGESKPVLTACEELAMIFGARLHLLYVVPTRETVGPEEVPSGRLVPSTTRFLLDLEADDAASQMREELQVLHARGVVEASGSVERGEAVPAVVGTAISREADMIALATRGLAGLGAFWTNDMLPRIVAGYDGVFLLFPTRKGRRSSTKDHG